MKKLLLLIAAFGFITTTATFAQTADQAASTQEPAKAAIGSETPASMPKSCCKSGSNKSCNKSTAGKSCAGANSKSCSHAHADAHTDHDKAAVESNVQPAASKTDESAEPKK